MKTKDIIELGKYLQKLEDEGCPIEITMSWTNMGIVEKPIYLREYQEFREYMNLGGRSIIINIEIPNKGINVRLKELEKE